MASFLWTTVGIFLFFTSVNSSPLNHEEENLLPQAQIKEIQESGSMVAEYIWSVRNVQQLLLSTTREGAVVGPVFYTGRPGYKIRLSLSSGKINPTDGLPYLGLWFSFETGLYDEVLDWPFPYTLNLTLLDWRKTGHRIPDIGEDSFKDPVSVHPGSQHPGTEAQSLGNSGSNQQDHLHSGSAFQHYGNSQPVQLGFQPQDAGFQNQGSHDTRFSGPTKQDWRPKSNQIQDFTLPNRRMSSFRSLKENNKHEAEISGDDSLLHYHMHEGWNPPLKTNQGTSKSLDEREFKVSHGLSQTASFQNENDFISQNGRSELQNNDSPKNNIGNKSKDSRWLAEQRDIRKISTDTHIGQSILSGINRGSESSLTLENNFSEQPSISRVFASNDNVGSPRSTHIPDSGASLEANHELKLPGGPVTDTGFSSQIYKGPLLIPEPPRNSRWLDDYKDSSDVPNNPTKVTNFQHGTNQELSPTGEQEIDRSLHLTITPSSVLCQSRKQLRRGRRGRKCGKGFFVPLDQLLTQFVWQDELLVKATVFLQKTPRPEGARVHMRGHQLVSEFQWDVPQSEGGRVSSAPFHVNSASYLVVLWASFARDNLGVFVTLVPGPYDSALQWPFSYGFELSVTDPQGNQRKLSVDPTSGTCPLQAFTQPKYRPNPPCGFRKLTGLARNGTLAVKFTAILDQMPNFAKLAVKEGFLVAEYAWRVPNIERKMQLSRSLVSERFYSRDQGHLLQLQLRLNASSATAGLFLTLLEGAHDALLVWPFQTPFQLRVVDQGVEGRDMVVDVDPRDPNCAGAFWRPFGRNDACGSSSAATYEQLYDRKFIRYGAILLKVVLFLEEIRPPRFATLTLSQRHLAARFEWRVPDLPDRTRPPDPGSFLDSDKFYLSNSGYRMMLRLYPARTDGQIGLYAVLAKGAYDDDLDWPFRHPFKLEVTAGDRKYIRTLYPGESGSGCPAGAFHRPDRELAEWSCGEGRMAPHLSLEGDVVFGVEVLLQEFPIPPVAALRVDPRSGALVARYSWIVKQAASALEQLRTGEKDTVESEIFYTENQGYALRLSMTVAGQSMEDIGLFWTLQRGQHDDALQWPFRGPVTLSLVDPSHINQRHLEVRTGPDSGSCPSAAFDRPKQLRNDRSCGFPALASLSTIRRDFVDNDVLHIRATVILN